MFQKTRYQLLLSYLAVLASILGIFTLAVRVVFTRSLSQQLTNQLTTLGQVAAANAEFKQGRLEAEDDFSTKDLTFRHQALQWFDPKGHIIAQQGRYVLTQPLSINKPVQIQRGKISIQGVTLPVIGSDNSRLIGYVRVSQSLEELDETLNKLDLGLGSGVAIALILSSVGGIWLTRQAMQPIEQSFQRLKQFTADASHELRNPLMAITSNVAVAQKYPEGMRPTDAEKFNAIASAANQITRLTEDLLLLARSDQVHSPRREVVNLKEILNNLVQLYQPQAETKQINLSANLTGRLYLMGNSVQLTRAFANLIENALQYTSTGGTVEIQSSSVGQQLYVKVTDTGMGIAPEHLLSVFERFWRAESARSYRTGGSGLGLAIAQTIAKDHGGLITVTSQLGVGSCFTVRLPAGASA